MTSTIDRTDAAVRVDQWLSAFQDALASGDPEAAGALFGAESFWRDLVAFTWNITTVEGPDGVADMLAPRSRRAGATGFRITEPATEADGVTDGLARRSRPRSGAAAGMLRLKDGKAWTLLTTLDELKGHEEPQGAAPAARASSTAPTRTA